MRKTLQLAILLMAFLLPAVSAIAQVTGLKAMTFNIRYDNPEDGANRWENRKSLVVESLVAELPDIIGMQEVLAGQASYLRENLKGYSFVGVGRDDGKNAGEFSPVFFKSDRFEMIDWGTLWLSPTPEDTGSVGWDAALPRICTRVNLVDRLTADTIVALNTHFDHMGQRAREESARLITSMVSSIPNHHLVIVTGDFNCTSEEAPYRVMTSPKAGLRDACAASPAMEACRLGTFNGFGKIENRERIDYVFFRGDRNVFSYKVLKIIKDGVYISDHYPVVIQLGNQNPGIRNQIIQTFTFDSITTRRAVFDFPPEGQRYEKILMYYTLKCDSLTPHDKYPCGEWDYTTYTRVYHKTGKLDSARMTQPSFTVKGKSPAQYYYSDQPTYTYFERYPAAAAQDEAAADHCVKFDGSGYITVPGEAFREVSDELTVAFWLNGDPEYQPMASTIFEGLDKDGLRVVNLHVPYDNGVVYWDAGGHGDGLTDNIYKAASPRDYKGRWTHWAVTKNAFTGEQKIYKDGKLFITGTGLKRKMDGIVAFRIGSNGQGNGRFYRGSMDDFACWARELDSLEVFALAESVPVNYPSEGLLFAYDFNDPSRLPFIPDAGPFGLPGESFGHPQTYSLNGPPFPEVKPRHGQDALRDSIMNARVSIVIYGDSLKPQKPTDTITAWPGYHYLRNHQGLLIDSIAAQSFNTLKRKTHAWYGEPFEVIEQFEIGRFITPYGKRLDLGLHGFTWVYDVTDYEPLLHGKVDLQAANGQELLDLRFEFIPGVPPRDVISVRNIWPEGSYTYKELADDNKLNTKNLKLNEKAQSFMLRARISGHGHAGPYNCCEWDPKRHSWQVNGEKAYEWQVWRDCGMNPVYPQGGTWQFDRAGWCPGTFVDTYDFEMTSRVKPGENVSIDYQIQPYDPDNGEEAGNFEMAMHLFEYSAPNFRVDLELNDILAPSARQEYRRMNPISLNPVVRVRNTGSDTVFSFTVAYGMEGGEVSLFAWSGRLACMQTADIILPKPSWKGMTGDSKFMATIESVNGANDDRITNNRLTSTVEAPVVLPGKFIVYVKTQGFGRAADNAFRITGAEGKVVAERLVYEDTTTYRDKVKLKPGAYDFTFTDKNEDGMIRHWWLYWEDKEKVGDNGELKILDMDGNLLLDLGYDWAEKRTLQFFVGEPE